MGRYDRLIKDSASIMSNSKNVVASSGAGVSAESGIPTFRDPGGLWDIIDPYEVGTTQGLVNALEKNSGKLFPIILNILTTFVQAEPNPGHYAIADLQKMGILHSVITQNIDNLHQEAGSSNVIEVHGNMFRMRCTSCGHFETVDRKTYSMELSEKLIDLDVFNLENLLSLIMKCDSCGSVMRPDVVMFGEQVHDVPQAFEASQKCDVMLVLGTSGVVYPAAYFPVEAKRSGAKVIVINPSENAFVQDADVYLPMKTGEALPLILNLIKN